MSIKLQIIVAVLVLLMLLYIIRMISKKKIDIRYALRWMALCIIVLVFDIFPKMFNWLSKVIGIQLPSNMIFMVAIILLITTMFALTTNVSRISQKNTRLIQEVALLRDEIDKIKEKEQS
ncbi:MAG: DUF2304 domain-containing protein [Lachnospiraceae bacterium]|nr:DUF2304 domain-containing protein [Lachnospiraceae bacterium]